MPLRALLIALLALVVVAAPAGAQPYGALRFFEEPGPPPPGADPLAGSCFAPALDAGVGSQRCERTPALEGARDVALSADGRSAYVAAPDADAVVAFQRDGDGHLRPAGCVSAAGGSGCAQGPGLDGAAAVAVSPDGRNVYIASRTADAVATFRRDPETGGLTPDACLGDPAAGCTSAVALDHATGVEVSPDGANVYVAARGSDAIAVFARGTDGALAQLPGPEGCLQDGFSPGAEQPACADAPALDGAYDLELDPSGRLLTAASRVSDSVAVFTRGPGGALAPAAGEGACLVQSPRPGCTAVGRGLDGATSVAQSPDGRSTYVASYAGSSVATLRRDPESGTLRLAGCASDGRERDSCVPSPSLAYAQRVAVSPDGRNVYAVARDSAAVAVFERERDGTLTQALPEPGRSWSEGCISWRGHRWTAGGTDLSAADHSDHLCARTLGLYYPYGLAVAPGGGEVLVAAERSHTLTVLRRETSAPDTTAPAPAISAPANDTLSSAREVVVSGRPGLAFGDEDAVEVQLAQAAAPDAVVRSEPAAVSPAEGVYTARLAGLGDGDYLAQAVQRDGAGNVGRSAPVRVTIDGTPSDTVLSGGPPARTTALTAGFSLRATEPGATLACRLDGGPWAPCGPAVHGLQGLARGAHRFEARATDRAGNADPTPALHRWRVVAAPRIAVLGRRTLGAAVRRGLAVRVTCDGACVAQARLAPRAGGRSLVKVRRALRSSGSARLRVRAARRHARRRGVRLVVRVTGPGGEPLGARTVTLRR